MYRKYMENGITKWGDDYSHCGLCDELISSQNEQEIYSHINSKKHKTTLNFYSWDNVQVTKELQEVKTLSEETYSLFVKNNICFRDNYYFCNYCFESLDQLCKANKHVSEGKHKMYLKFDYQKIFHSGISINNRIYHCQFCNKQFTNIKKVQSHLIARKHIGVVNKSNLSNKNYLIKQISEEININEIILQENEIEAFNKKRLKCKACNLVFKKKSILQHVESTDHMKKLDQTKPQGDCCEKNEIIIFHNTNEYFYCRRCNYYLDTKDCTLIECHAMHHLLRKRLGVNLDIMRFDEIDEKTFVICILCDKKMKCDQDMVKHVKSVLHLKNWQKISSLKSETPNDLKLSPEINKQLSRLKYNPNKDFTVKKICLTCYKPKVMDITGHIIEFDVLPSENHTHDENSCTTVINNFHFYVCFLCQQTFLNVESLYEHYFHDSDHNDRIKKFYATLDDINKNFISLIEQDEIVLETGQKSKPAINANTAEKGNTEENTENKLVLLNTNCIKITTKSGIKCSLCKEVLESTKILDHIKTEYHLLNFHFKTQSSLRVILDNVIINISSDKGKYFFCKKCQFYLPLLDDTLIQCHCMIHLWESLLPVVNLDIIRYKVKNDKSEITCLLCDEKMNNDKELANHLDSILHINQLQNNILMKIENRNNIALPKVYLASVRHNFHPDYDFDLQNFCSTFYKPKIADDKNHITEFQKLETESNYEQKNPSITKICYNFYRCFLCDQSFRTLVNLFKHYNYSDSHIYRLQNYYATLGNSKPKLIDENDLSEMLEKLNSEKSALNELKKIQELDEESELFHIERLWIINEPEDEILINHDELIKGMEFSKEESILLMPLLQEMKLDRTKCNFLLNENHVTRKRPNNYRCYICNKKYTSAKIMKHLLKIKHLKKLHTFYEVGGLNRLFHQNEYCFCKKCGIYFSMSEILIQYHCLLHMYKEYSNSHFDIIKFNSFEKKIDLECLLCNIQMQTNEALVAHVKSSLHLCRLQLNLILKSPNRDRNEFLSIFHKKQSLNFYEFNPKTDLELKSFCSSCYRPNGFNKNYLIYVFHQNPNAQCFNRNSILHEDELIISKYNINFYKCFLCDKSFNEKDLLLEHCKTDLAHKHRFTNFYGDINVLENSNAATEQSENKKEVNTIEEVDLTEEEQDDLNGDWFFMSPKIECKHLDAVSKQTSSIKKDEPGESIGEQIIEIIEPSEQQEALENPQESNNESNFVNKSQSVGVEFTDVVIESDDVSESTKSDISKSSSKNETINKVKKIKLETNWIKYFHCKICKDYFKEEKFVSSHCMYHLHKDYPDLNNDIIKISFTGQDVLINCLICNKLVKNYRTLKNHQKKLSHTSKIKNLQEIVNTTNDISSDQRYETGLNSLTRLPGTFDPIVHLSIETFCTLCYSFDSEKKNGRWYNLNYTPNHNHNRQETWLYEEISSKLNFFKCYLCQKLFPSKEFLFQHYKTDLTHKSLIKVFKNLKISDQRKKPPAKQISPVEKINVQNVIPPAKINNDSVLKTSISSKKTKENTVSQASLCLVEDEIFIKLGPIIPRRKPIKNIGAQNPIPPVKANENLKLQVPTPSMSKSKNLPQDLTPSAKASKEIKANVVIPPLKPDKSIVVQNAVLDKKINEPKAPQTPIPSTNKTNEVQKYGAKFYSMCIKSGAQNMYHFNPEEVDLMIFSISLIFPYKNEGLCIPCFYVIKLDLQSIYEHLQNRTHIENIKDLKSLEGCGDSSCPLDKMKSSIFDDLEENNIKCLACNQNISKNDDRELISHVTSSSHALKVKLWKEFTESLGNNFFKVLMEYWYHACRYYCAFCKVETNCEMTIVKHLLKPSHKEKLKSIQKNYKFNKCLGCHSCWYGIADDYKMHYEDSFHKKCKFDFFPKLSREACKLLMFPVVTAQKLLKKSNQVMELDKKNEKKLLSDAQNTVRPIYPNAKAYAFGSRTFCLGFPSSDLDVFLDCENIYNKIGSQENSQMYIRKVKRLFLPGGKGVWKYEAVLIRPRVPIMKLEHKLTHLKCDLSFLNGLGVEKSQLLRKFVTAYQECRELMLYLKKWFETVDLYGSTAVNAYAISWLVVFYLQIKKVFPSVHELVLKKNKSKLVGGWECGFPNKIDVKDNKITFKKLLNEFFSYYAKFDYQKNVICPYLGKVVTKSQFVQVNDLPSEMIIYKNRLKAKDGEYFTYDSPFCVQDPVDLSQNLTKVVTKLQLKKFRQYCKESFDKLHAGLKKQ